MTQNNNQLLSSLLTQENIEKLISVLETSDKKSTDTCDNSSYTIDEKSIALQRKIDIINALLPFFEGESKQLLNKVIRALIIAKALHLLLYENS